MLELTINNQITFYVASKGNIQLSKLIENRGK